MILPSEIENTISVFNSRYNKKTNAIYITLLLALLATFALLPFIYVDITSQSRGLIRAVDENVDIESIVTGRIEYVNVSNNKQVHVGDTLLKIDDTAIEAKLMAQRGIVRDIQNRLNDLNVLIYGSSAPVKLVSDDYKQEYDDYCERKKEAELKFSQSQRDYEVANRGFAEGVISKTKRDLAHDKMKIAEQNVITLLTQQLTSWNTARVSLDEQLSKMLAEIKTLETEKNNCIIISPIDGTILIRKQLSTNAFVYSGQNIATISPDDNLIVECYVKPTDIGFVKPGQKVALQFDAFNYNQWGLGSAEVFDIDKNLTIQDSNSFFVVRCKITNHALSLKNGYTVKVKKGMTLTGRFFITERTLWQLLFDKIDDWFNPVQS
ncbi:MAG: HlyD family efflux transporter periplasmic adaptor subunit [Marinilabiliaceae bacterium]|mgnify:CR=1 FL=1|nr:HlyD family efflux transporter periplasmic adaptor subunit [Marinilabiliaceae bacterium]